ncbi:MAG: Ldh family oxidoreductase [Actinomycetota bacterium]
MMWCNADPSVAAYGGKDRLFGTNPFAAGIPSDDVPVVIDFATAQSAEGKLRVARQMGSLFLSEL